MGDGDLDAVRRPAVDGGAGEGVLDGNAELQKRLELLNAWRNAIAHQSFDKVGGKHTLRLTTVRQWRRAAESLAITFDTVVGTHLGVVLGKAPW